MPFLPERMKFEILEKLVANLHDKTEYVIQIRNIKQALNYRLVLKKLHGVIKFNQNPWLKPYSPVQFCLNLEKIAAQAYLVSFKPKFSSLMKEKGGDKSGFSIDSLILWFCYEYFMFLCNGIRQCCSK